MSNVDESLYSRQIYTFGMDAMTKINRSSILITCRYNFSGCALELAKCIILAGMSKVSIHANYNILTYRDLSSNYYESEKNIGLPFINNVLLQLKQLNTHVDVNIIDNLADITQYKCVVFCDYDIHELYYWNNITRQNNIKFIMLQSYGLLFNMFCDFIEHAVDDINGEEIKNGIINYVKSNRFVTADQHNMYSGNIISFSGIINGVDTKNNYKIKVINSNEFEIPQLIITDQKLNHVMFKEIKQQLNIKFKSLMECINNPEYDYFDTDNINMPLIQNCFMIAMSTWRKNNTNIHNNTTYINTIWLNFPNADDKTLKLYFDIECKRLKIKCNDDIFHKLAYTCKGSICAVDAIAGSICAQEVIKSVTHKFIPCKQFLHYNALNVLPDNYISIIQNNTDYAISNTRYDGQCVIFGKKYMQILQKQKIFIVGAGAIGCEHIKNFSMMGFHDMLITDMDNIERSNLNRQFLFRNADIGKSKSVVAATMAHKLNNDVKVISYENKICSDTLNIYNSQFFDNVDIVANALDNVEARLFVDTLCVKYRKPLLESGTMGTKGSIQCIIPDLTEPYSALQDKQEQDIAVCTLKLFPYKYEHIVQYARDMFEGYFNRIPNNYIKAQTMDISKLTPIELLTIKNDVNILANVLNFKDCIKTGYEQWHVIYRDNINQLIKKYPIDHVDESKNTFWTGNKLFPKSFVFDITNKLDVDFVIHFAHIFADILQITKRYSYVQRDKFINYLQSLHIPCEINTDEINTDEINCDNVINEIKQLITIKNVIPINFEKDDTTNHHIEFITVFSNKRATNYGIEYMDMINTKRIAGKIIPAVATTTSIVSGLVAIEIYKVIYGNIESTYNTIQRYRFGSFNLAVQLFGFSESYPVKIYVINNKIYSVWTHIKINKNTLLTDIINEWTNVTITHKINGKIITTYACIDLLIDDNNKTIYSNNYDSEDEIDNDVSEYTKYMYMILKYDENYITFIMELI